MLNLSEKVISQAANGDIRAFEEVYRASSSFVFNVALRIIRNKPEAEEITQDVYIKVHKNLKKFRFQSSFKTWLYRITTNTAINVYRKTSKEKTKRVDFDTALATIEAKNSGHKIIEKHDSRRLVDSLLDELTAEQRACIVFKEIEGLSYKEISQILNIKAHEHLFTM